MSKMNHNYKWKVRINMFEKNMDKHVFVSRTGKCRMFGRTMVHLLDLQPLQIGSTHYLLRHGCSCQHIPTTQLL